MSQARLVQDYVRAKWRYPGFPEGPLGFGRQLPAALKERIDELGLDDQLLLEVGPEQVMERLEELESRILQEDLSSSIRLR